jgi:acetyl esterase/lipase
LIRFYRPGTRTLPSESRTTTAVNLPSPVVASSPVPVIIDYHGGGFVLGSLADDDVLCRQLCAATGFAVINVAYRTAPEFPHPTPAHDAWAAYQWVVRSAAALGLDAGRVVVCGLSAGACLAAGVAIRARDLACPAVPAPAAQVLVVPVLDVRYVPVSGKRPRLARRDSGKGLSDGDSDGETVDKGDYAGTRGEEEGLGCPYPSYITYEHAPCLPLVRLQWFYDLWLGTGPERRVRAECLYASPMAATSLAGLPPASLHVAGVDPLRSEAEAFHARLLREGGGGSSRITVYEGVGHPFGQWGGRLEEGRKLADDIATFVREIVG